MLTDLKIIHVFWLIVLLCACSSDKEPVEQSNLADTLASVDETSIIQKGNERPGTDILTGIVAVPSENITYVTLPAGGYVDRLYVSEGEKVRRGNLLAKLTNPQYVKLQQEYLESKARLAFVKKEFTRQGELTMEHASSIKKLEKAEAEYLSEESTFLGIQKILKMTGFEPDSISPDNMLSELNVYAPANGMVTKIKAHSGKYMDPTQWLFEIVNADNLILQMNIDSDLVQKIYGRENVTFYIPGKEEKKMQAEVLYLSPVSDENGKISVIASIPNGVDLVPGMMCHVIMEEINQ